MKTDAVPLVSVVIPTRNRADLFGRSVQSALNQTFRSIEVIVVLDRADERTIQTLAQFEDSRLYVVTLPQSVGAQEAPRLSGANRPKA
jgi:glycosyltransferase involved in cell wall biosynthesis